MRKNLALNSGSVRTWARRLLLEAAARPALAAAGLLFVLFGSYLYSTEPLEFYYDSSLYWELASKFWPDGHFDFLAYDHPLRGYLFPLLLSALLRVAEHYPLMPVTLTRTLGAAVAAGLFGVVGPGLWQAAQRTGPAAPVPLGRRLLFGALGFVFWRGYFHYPLTDFPALLALAGGLWAALRARALPGGLLAGALVAAAVNFRPVYAIVLPLAGLLCWWPRPAAASEGWRSVATWSRELGFTAGVLLLLAPQAAINQRHFGVVSPFVLTVRPPAPSLFLVQLQWGVQYQKYETNTGSDYPEPTMFFTDAAGSRLWRSSGRTRLDTYSEYWELLRREPATVVGSWLRHLFNGLDVQYPTPYIKAVYVATWPLVWLNFSALVLGLAVLFRRVGQAGARPEVRTVLALLALLGPCLATLPVAMECRFLLPLHLLLCAAAAFAAHPRQLWRACSARQLAFGLALYAGSVGTCLVISSRTQAQLEKGGRTLAGGRLAEPW